MNRITSILFSFAFVLITASSGSAQKADVQEPALAKELKSMRDYDQKLRNKWVGMIKKDKKGTKKFTELTDLLIATDEKNTARMKVIVHQHGWPTRTMVGNGPSNNAWILVQHADRDPLFQIECLPLLKAAVDSEQANPTNYAYLYDRVAVSQGNKQLYATQSSSNNGLVKGNFYPIEDESNVQVRRVAMEINQPVEDYAQSMGFEYTVPSAEEAIRRKTELIENYNSNIKKAKSAEDEKDFDTAIDYYKKATAAYGVAKAEDFYNYARLVCINNPKESGYAAYSLVKAALKGYPNPQSWDTDPIFSESKESSPRNWKMLMNTINHLTQITR